MTKIKDDPRVFRRAVVADPVIEEPKPEPKPTPKKKAAPKKKAVTRGKKSAPKS